MAALSLIAACRLSSLWHVGFLIPDQEQTCNPALDDGFNSLTTRKIPNKSYTQSKTY